MTTAAHLDSLLPSAESGSSIMDGTIREGQIPPEFPPWSDRVLVTWPHPRFPRHPVTYIANLDRIENHLQDLGLPPLIAPELRTAILDGRSDMCGRLDLEDDPISAWLNRFSDPLWSGLLRDDRWVLHHTATLMDRLRMRCALLDPAPEQRVHASLIPRRLTLLAVMGIDPQDRDAVEAATLNVGKLPPAWAQPDAAGLFMRPYLLSTVEAFIDDYVRFYAKKPWSEPQHPEPDDFAPERPRRNHRSSPSRAPRHKRQNAEPDPAFTLCRVIDAEDQVCHTPKQVARLLIGVFRAQTDLAPDPIHLATMVRYLERIARVPSSIHRFGRTVLLRTIGLWSCYLGIPVRDVLSFSIDDRPDSLAQLMDNGLAVSLHLGNGYYPSMYMRVPQQEVLLSMPDWTHPYLERATDFIRARKESTVGGALAASATTTSPLDAVREEVACVLGAGRPDGGNHLADAVAYRVLHRGWLYLALRQAGYPRGWVQAVLGRIVGGSRSDSNYYSCTGQECATMQHGQHTLISKSSGVPPPIIPYRLASPERIGQKTPPLADSVLRYCVALSQLRGAATLAALADLPLTMVGRRPTSCQPHPAHSVIRIDGSYFVVISDKDCGSGYRPRIISIPDDLAAAAIATGEAPA